MTPADLDGLIAWRRFLHMHPEISGEELSTARLVHDRLARLAPENLIEGLGGHGVLAQFRGAAPKVRILLRCELDALPITEENAVGHRSKIVGKAHLCGHDGHMAILMGVAEALSDQRIEGADVLLLFQPAEETGAGAQAVLDDPAFATFSPDIAVALHNVPGLPLGRIEVRPGPVCCASRGLKIRLTGRTAHASQPETGDSPAAVMMAVMAGIAKLSGPLPAEGVPAHMATLTHATLGEATFGVAPGVAEVFVTLRTIRDDDMVKLCHAAETLVTQSCAGTPIQASLSWHDVFPAAVNDLDVVDIISSAAKGLSLDMKTQEHPMRWSEDFGRFGAHTRAALFLLGAGESTPALHSPDYDFPDALIGTGIAAFLGIVGEAARA